MPVFLPGNPMDRGAWQATVHEDTKSWTRLSTAVHTHTHTHTFSLLKAILLFCVCKAIKYEYS